MRKPDSLRGQLLIWAMVPMLVVLLASALGTYLIASTVANRAYDYSLLDTARTIALRVHPTNDGAPEVALSPGVREVLEYDPLDTVYYAVRSRRFGLLAGRGDVPRPHEVPGGEGLLFDARIDEHPARFFTLPYDDDVQITVGETLNKRDSLTKQILIALLLTESLLIVVGSALLWYGIGRGMAPLQRIIDALATRGQHDLRPIQATGAASELRSLANSISDLMGRLQQSLTLQHRFIADAAHQLRTPLAGLLAQIDSAMADPDPHRSRQTMEQLRTSSKRAARLVNQLLALARAERGQQVELDFEWVDLAFLVRETCKHWVPEALRGDMDLAFEGPEHEVVMQGNAPLLEEALGNLIENAIRYGRSRGWIIVRLECVAEALMLEVSNEGEPIPQSERVAIFERFHRIPGSAGEGCGLGLAIVNDVARMHRGSVELHSSDGVNSFVMWFPSTSSLPLTRAGDRLPFAA